MATKVVLVGDGACGKTTLLVTTTTGHFSSTLESEKTIYETRIKYKDSPSGTSTSSPSSSLTSSKGEKTLHFYDTTGQDENQRQRLVVYPGTDVFIVAFSIVSPYSFENVRSKWYPELSRYAPQIPIILVGTKLDLRNDSDALERLKDRKLAPISYPQGNEMKKEIGAVCYVECSAVDGEGLGELLEVVLEVTGGRKGGEKGGKKGKKKKEKEKEVEWARKGKIPRENSIPGDVILLTKAGEEVELKKKTNCSMM